MFYLWQFEGRVPALVCVETQQIHSWRFECLGGRVLGGLHRGSDGTAGSEPRGPEGAGPGTPPSLVLVNRMPFGLSYTDDQGKPLQSVTLEDTFRMRKVKGPC